MAFGAVRGTLSGSGGSVLATSTATGSVAVSVGDLVVVMISEVSSPVTTTAVTDNLGGTYTPHTTSTVAGRLWHRYVGTAGTLTTISCAMTASSNDYAIAAGVFEGPFSSPPLDSGTTTGVTADAITPFVSASTGTLSQASELIVGGLYLTRGQTDTTAVSPLLLVNNVASAADNTANSVSSTLGAYVVSATTSVTVSFAATGTINAGNVFFQAFRALPAGSAAGSTSATSTVTGTSRVDISRAGAAAVTTGTTGTGRSDIARAGSSSAAATVTATGLATTPVYPLGLIAWTDKRFLTHDGGTTDPIDTSGANFLFLQTTEDINITGLLTVSDNKGNTWQFDGTELNRASGGNIRLRVYSHNPNSGPANVGPNHTFTVTGTSSWVSIQVAAFRYSGSFDYGPLSQSPGALPHGSGNVFASAGDLIITGAGGTSNFLSVSSGVIVSNFPIGDSWPAAYAYYIAPSTGNLNPIWTGTGTSDAAVITQSLHGIWIDANASRGQASASSTASGVAPVANDTGVGTASALGVASGVGLATIDTGTGTASAHATATGVSPAAAVSAVYLVSSYTPGTPRNDYPGYVGLAFRTDIATEHRYNRMGIRAEAGNTGLHTVGLYHYTGGDGTPIGTPFREVDIDLTGSTTGNWYYAEIPEITLSDLTFYFLAATVTAGGQSWANEGPVTLIGCPTVFSAYSPAGGPWSAPATGDASFVGVDLALIEGAAPVDDTGVGTSTATSTVNATGRYDVAIQATSTATSTVTATGRSDAPRIVSSTATSTVTATGRSDARANASTATATSTVTATGSSDSPRTVTAAATSTVTGTSRSDIARAVSAAATGLATAFSSSGLDVSGAGTAAATSTVTATGRSDAPRTVSSTAASTVTATGRSDIPRTGSSTATSTVNATSRYDISRTGTSTATSTVSAESTASKNLTTTRYIDPDVFGNPIVEVVGGLVQYVTPNRYVDPDTFKAHTLSVGPVTLVQTRYVDPDTFKAHNLSLILNQTRYVDPDSFKSHQLNLTIHQVTRFNDPDIYKLHKITLTVNQTKYIDPDTFKSHTISRGTVTLTTTRFVDPDSFKAHTITGGINLQTTRYIDPDTFKSHSLRAYNVLVESKYVDPDIFYTAHIITSDTQNIHPARFINTPDFGDPLIGWSGPFSILGRQYAVHMGA